MSGKVRKKKVDEFSKEFLVWFEMSWPYITTGIMNGQIYRDEWHQKRLLLFLRSHERETLFWPDLATCHYAGLVLDWYGDNKVVFVPKDYNPPKSPELTIEQFGANFVKAELRKTSSIRERAGFEEPVGKVPKKVGRTIAQNLISGVKDKAWALDHGGYVRVYPLRV